MVKSEGTNSSSKHNSMQADEAEQELIDNDKKQYPNCQYSVAFSQVCSSRNGEGTVCESTRNLQRFCPGQRPVTISSRKEKFSGTDNDLGGDVSMFRRGGGGGFFGFGREEDDDFFGESSSPHRGFNPFGFAEDILGQFAREIESEIARQQPPSRGPALPPHRQLPPSEASPESSRGSLWGNWFSDHNSDKTRGRKPKPPFGDIQGPVEEI